MSKWSFRKSVKLLPGIRLNLGKNSIGISGGVRGARIGFNSKRGAYSHLSIPGTGLYKREYFGSASPSESPGYSVPPHRVHEPAKPWILAAWIILSLYFAAFGPLRYLAILSLIIAAYFLMNRSKYANLQREPVEADIAPSGIQVPIQSSEQWLLFRNRREEERERVNREAPSSLGIYDKALLVNQMGDGDVYQFLLRANPGLIGAYLNGEAQDLDVYLASQLQS